MIRPLKRTAPGCYGSADGRLYFVLDREARETRDDERGTRRVRRWDLGEARDSCFYCIDSFRTLRAAVAFAEKNCRGAS